MEFYIDIGAAVLLRILKDRRELKKLRPLFIKLYRAILAAYELDPDFPEATQLPEKHV